MHKLVKDFEERLKNLNISQQNVLSTKRKTDEDLDHKIYPRKYWREPPAREYLEPSRRFVRESNPVHNFIAIKQWFRSTVQEDPNFPIYYNWKRVDCWDDSNQALDLISHDDKKIHISFKFTPDRFAIIYQNFYNDSDLPHTFINFHTSTEFKQWILRQHNPKFIQTIMFLHENGISKGVKFEQYIHWTQIYSIDPPTIYLQNGYVFGKLTFDEDRYFAQYVVDGQRNTTFLTFDDLRQWILQRHPNHQKHSLRNQCSCTYYTTDSKH